MKRGCNLDLLCQRSERRSSKRHQALSSGPIFPHRNSTQHRGFRQKANQEVTNMRNVHQRIPLIAFFWLLGIQLSNGAMPSPEAVGRLLGYPPTELLIEDNTSEQRSILQAPSRRDQNRKTVLPDPTILQKAYLIHGKNKESFFPIQVYMGKKGAFLTSEVRDMMAKGDALPARRRAAGTEGFGSIGRAGWYLTQHFKVKATRPPGDIPKLVVAYVGVVQPHGEEFDVQIAQREDLELKSIPGGENYFEAFGPSAGEKTVDGPYISRDLVKLVIAGWLADLSARSVGSPPQPFSPGSSAPATTDPTPSLRDNIEPCSECVR